MAEERRTQIFEAFRRCVAREGLEKTTLDAVAREAGLQRSAIRHFVGNRDQLVREALVALAAEYYEAFDRSVAEARGKARIDLLLAFLFDGAFAHEHGESDRVVNALLAGAAADEGARRALREMYEGFLESVERELRSAYPKARAPRRREAAWAILCIAETHVTMIDLGFDESRTELAKRAARRILDGLRSRD